LKQIAVPVNHSITQLGLNTDYGAGYFDTYRAWDFLVLGRGNIPLVFFTIAAAWIYFYLRRINDRQRLSILAPFFALIGVSVLAWLMIVVLFFAPAVLHHLPQAAVFGVAIGGSVVIHQVYPKLFRAMAWLMLFYFSIVWVLVPLRNALMLDYGALSVMVLVLSFLVRQCFVSDSDLAPPLHGLAPPVVAELPTVNHVGRQGGTILSLVNDKVWSMVLSGLLVFAFLFLSYFAIFYLGSPLVDAHAFRQTQTALTAYWILKEGWTLAYQTPVAGFPWSIPFEFPFYQLIAVLVSKISTLGLDASGRLVSYVSLVCCAIPAYALSKRFGLPKTVPMVFCTLLWTSPLYVYWGRTFMIETMALVLILSCLPFGVDVIRKIGGRRSIFLYFILATAAVLQKATTAGPVLLILFAFVCVYDWQSSSITLGGGLRTTFYRLLIIGLPVLIGLVWARYADGVKLANPFGSQLTSQALSAWNFGSLSQKLSFETWKRVVWDRCLVDNGAGLLGVGILLMPWILGRTGRRFATMSGVLLVLFILPVLIFTNLHVVHDYYQAAVLAFLLAAFAVVIGGYVREHFDSMALGALLTFSLVLSNVYAFSQSYGYVTARVPSQQDSLSFRAYEVGLFLREKTTPQTSLAIFGQGVSSEIPYHAQRKAIVVPPWFKQYQDLWESPQKYLGDVPLAAVVVCLDANGSLSDPSAPSLAGLRARYGQNSEWDYYSVQGCDLAIARRYSLRAK
jgi:hypothetical protein